LFTATLSCQPEAKPCRIIIFSCEQQTARDHLPSIDQAKADALSSLFEMAADELSGEHESNIIGIDITDGQRTVLASVKQHGRMVDDLDDS